MRLLFLGFVVAALSGHSWLERRAFLMGTTLRIRVAATDQVTAGAAIEHAFRAVARWEDLLSTWRDDTQLARLNAAAVGVPVPLPRGVIDALLEARRWSVVTERAFDPAVGSLINAWHLRTDGGVPAPTTLDAALAGSGFRHFRIDSAAGAVTRLHPDAWLDAGGFGKGLALRAAVGVLRAEGITEAILDFGGQIAVVGPPLSGEARIIAVAHPKRRRDSVLWLRLWPGQSAATTSISERRVEVDGHVLGHVIDPRTGHPVAGWGSVTVVAADPVVADILSTALFVMGPEEARAWSAWHPDIGVVMIPVTGKPEWSPGLDTSVIRSPPPRPGSERLP